MFCAQSTCPTIYVCMIIMMKVVAIQTAYRTQLHPSYIMPQLPHLFCPNVQQADIHVCSLGSRCSMLPGCVDLECKERGLGRA